MSEPNDEHDPIDEELVAYLDGELEPEAVQRLEARLVADAGLCEKLQQHRRAWELLDELPRTDVGQQFTQTTVEMVAVSVADEVDDASLRDSRRTKFHWLIGGGVAVAAGLAGYVLIASIVAAPNRQLVEDLRVIENLDEYRAVDEIEFLRALQRERLFVAEEADER